MKHHVAFFAVLMSSVVLFWTFLDAVVRLSLGNDRYTHIFVIPLITVCLVLWNRSAIFVDKRWCPRLALPLLGLVTLLYVTAIRVDQLSLGVFALMTTWTAGFVLCYGVSISQVARFPLLLLLLIVPIPPVLMEKIVFLLQTGSSYFCWVLFELAGTPVHLSRFTFELPHVGIEVAKECSSIHSAWALFITGLLVGHFFLWSFWSKVGLSLLTVPIAVFTNGIRIFTIWFLGTHVDSGFLSGNLHRQGGILFSLISLSVLLACVALLRKIEKRTLRTPRIQAGAAGGPEAAAASSHT